MYFEFQLDLHKQTVQVTKLEDNFEQFLKYHCFIKSSGFDHVFGVDI